MKRRLILALMQTRMYSWLLLRVIPFIRFTTYYTSLRGWKYMRGYRLLQPGHFLLTVDRKKLTTALIPGEFTHGAQCVDKGSEWEISEMTHTNYTKSTFFDICKESDRVVIMRCDDYDEEYKQNVIRACKSFDNAIYDVKFDLGVQALYCFELIYQSDYERRKTLSQRRGIEEGKELFRRLGLGQGNLMNLFQKISLFRDVRKVQGVIKEADMGKVKAGLKTTEFWLALLAAVIPVVNQHLGLNIPSDGVMTIAGVVVAYILGRSLTKKGVSGGGGNVQ